MPEFRVRVSEGESNGFDRMTVNEFLARYAVRTEETTVFTLPSPVRLRWIEKDDRTPGTAVCRRSTALFRQLQAIAATGAIITAVAWRGAKIGALGLYSLNYALRTPRGHKRGINIVRAFLEDRPGPRTPLRVDWPALLDYLEIRPIFTRKRAESKKPAPAQSTALSVLSSRTLTIMSHKDGDITKGKTRSRKRSGRAKKA